MHARSVVAAAIDTKTGELFKERLVPKNDLVIDWLRSLPGPVATAYEAELVISSAHARTSAVT